MLVRFDQPLSRDELLKIRIHRMTSEWPWTFEYQKYSRYTMCLPSGTKFRPFHSAMSHFRDSRLLQIWKNPKGPVWPQTDLEHIAVKSGSNIALVGNETLTVYYLGRLWRSWHSPVQLSYRPLLCFAISLSVWLQPIEKLITFPARFSKNVLWEQN